VLAGAAAVVKAAEEPPKRLRWTARRGAGFDASVQDGGGLAAGAGDGHGPGVGLGILEAGSAAGKPPVSATRAPVSGPSPGKLVVIPASVLVKDSVVVVRSRSSATAQAM
jgi:hypothetical protein